jgi:hypothetical protein
MKNIKREYVEYEDPSNESIEREIGEEMYGDYDHDWYDWYDDYMVMETIREAIANFETFETPEMLREEEEDYLLWL